MFARLTGRLVVDAKCADNEAAAAGVHRDWRGLVGLELL